MTEIYPAPRPDPQAVERELWLYRYTNALERGDFEIVEAILRRAEDDPRLESMLLDANAALSARMLHQTAAHPESTAKPGTMAKPGGAKTAQTFWKSINLSRLAGLAGIAVLLLAAAILFAAFMGPAVGNVFSNINQAMGPAAINHMPTLTPAVQFPAAQPTQAPELAFPTPAMGLTPLHNQNGYPAPQEPPQQDYPAPPWSPDEATSVAATAARATVYAITASAGTPAPAGTPASASPQVISTQVVEQRDPLTPEPSRTPSIGDTPIPLDATQTPQPRLVVRDAYLALTVGDPRQARAQVEAMVSRYAAQGAYVVYSAENAVQGSPQPMISMVLRVPVDRYDEAINLLVDLAYHVDVRQEQAQDVTGEYVDTQVRIKQLETAIDRLLQIAAEAKTTEDLLTIEKALSERKAELEALKGHAQYLNQTAALSRISLELRPILPTPTVTPTATHTPTLTATPTPTLEAWRPGETASRSTQTFLRDLRRFANGLIAFAITVLPWLLLAGVVGYGVYRIFKSVRH